MRAIKEKAKENAGRKQSNLRESKEQSAPPPQLIEAAEQRTSDFIKLVRKVMVDMEIEIDNNEGIYPFNSGRLSAREVCRRAGVSYQTLQGDLHKETTRIEVNSWVERVKARAIQGRKKVRKTVTERADTWKERHDSIAQHYHKNKLEMIDLRNDLATLRLENETLRKQLRVANGKIVPIERKKQKGDGSRTT